MQITLLCCAPNRFASSRSCDVSGAGSERRKNRIELRDHRGLTTDHQAIAAFETFHTATRPDIDVVNASGRKFFRAANVVDVIRISTIDEDVATFEMRHEIGDGS